MKYVDVAVQTVGFILATAIPFIGEDGGSRIGLLMILQLCLGGWQLLSCVISVLTTRTFRTAKLIGLAALFLYLGILRTFSPVSEVLLAILWTVPAWSLAIIYYVITWKWVLAGTGRRGSFLPHINF
jgi:hypothetical protein